jgi:hypothetical protein
VSDGGLRGGDRSGRKQKNLHKCLIPLPCIEHLFKKSSREES